MPLLKMSSLPLSISLSPFSLPPSPSLSLPPSLSRSLLAYDYPGSLISSHTSTRQRALSEAEDGSRVWHLFKQLDMEDPKRSPFMNKKLVSEIYLPRMLSTKVRGRERRRVRERDTQRERGGRGEICIGIRYFVVSYMYSLFFLISFSRVSSKNSPMTFSVDSSRPLTLHPRRPPPTMPSSQTPREFRCRWGTPPGQMPSRWPSSICLTS